MTLRHLTDIFQKESYDNAIKYWGVLNTLLILLTFKAKLNEKKKKGDTVFLMQLGSVRNSKYKLLLDPTF